MKGSKVLKEPNLDPGNGARFLYVTDLHGVEWKYEALLQYALAHGYGTIVNGGDLFPAIDAQEPFVRGAFTRFAEDCQGHGVRFLLMPGNDDLAVFDPLIEKICRKYPLVENIAGKKTVLGPLEMIGMNLVCDFPFRLKEKCRRDTSDFVFPVQHGPGMLSCRKNGSVVFRTIPDWPAYAMSLPTIREELLKLPEPQNPGSAVYIVHDPPAGIGLDVCDGNRAVGSKALAEFLADREPLACLSGHIHESPDVSGVWMGKIGGTTCVQPGQRKRSLVLVEVETHPLVIRRIVQDKR